MKIVKFVSKFPIEEEVSDPSTDTQAYYFEIKITKNNFFSRLVKFRSPCYKLGNSHQDEIRNNEIKETRNYILHTWEKRSQKNKERELEYGENYLETNTFFM